MLMSDVKTKAAALIKTVGKLAGTLNRLLFAGGGEGLVEKDERISVLLFQNGVNALLFVEETSRSLEALVSGEVGEHSVQESALAAVAEYGRTRKEQKYGNSDGTNVCGLTSAVCAGEIEEGLGFGEGDVVGDDDRSFLFQKCYIVNVLELNTLFVRQRRERIGNTL